MSALSIRMLILLIPTKKMLSWKEKISSSKYLVKPSLIF